jgi:competence protein CoiA
MKYALVNSEKKEAEKGLFGLCQGCGQQVLAVCGSIRVKHWRHKIDCECDHWWENETEWHREWKNKFPESCQEIRHKDDNGEWHISDVKTDNGFFLEFQHSFLKPEERQSRNIFYGANLIWIVDGLKRKRDLEKFEVILKNSKQIAPNFPLIKLPSFIEECSLLKEWSDCPGTVFFDFGLNFPLWCLLPKSLKSNLYIGPFSRQNFIELHNSSLISNGQNYSELTKALIDLISSYENPMQNIQPSTSLSNRRPTIQRPVPIGQSLRRQEIKYLNSSNRRRNFRF